MLYKSMHGVYAHYFCLLTIVRWREDIEKNVGPECNLNKTSIFH